MAQLKEITIKDIARTLNVSVATVSRGLQNHPATAPKTRKLIQEAAVQMGYRQNQSARKLANRKSNTLGVIIPNLTSHFMSCVIDGIEMISSKEGYNLLISHSSDSPAKEAESAKSLLNNGVDGLLASLTFDSLSKKLTHFEAFFKNNIPVIFFDRVMDHSSCTNILINNYKAAYDATTHLVSQGCKRIVHITSALRQNIYTDRLSGYRQALADNNLKFKDEYVITGNMGIDAGAEAALAILKMKMRPDGAFVANDNCAAGCMIALKQKGIKIPDEIAFAGFNNDPVCKVVEPNLTTINYSGQEVGILAARYLINHLNGTSPMNETSTVLLRHELIIRGSSMKNR